MIKMQFEDLSVFLEDLNESDFFEQTRSKNTKDSVKVTNNNVSKTEAKAELSSNKTTSLSPILFSKSKNKICKSFTSTPLKSKNLNLKEKEKPEKLEENVLGISESGYLEADLFDDWDVDVNSQKDIITLSQAFKLIEEAESERQSNQKEDLNNSVDLLTGKPVGEDNQDMFAESFSLPPNLVESKEKQNGSDYCLIKVEESTPVSGPSAAQGLDFKTKTHEEKNIFKIDFNSDGDDFDFVTQEILNKPKSVKPVTQAICFSPEESGENILRRGKCCRIIESDSADDSPDLTSLKWNKQKRNQKSCEKNLTIKFIQLEAEVSETIEVSSDESDEDEDEYDASFVDEELYLTQNWSADMTAKYLESVKNSNRPGRFKIPAPKPYSPAYVFSQIPEDSNTEYELNSFVVNEVEEEANEDLSELEIAENILELDRKKKKRKRIL